MSDSRLQTMDQQSTRQRFNRLAFSSIVIAIGVVATARAERIIVPAQQGTDIGVTTRRDAPLVMYLAGRLWQLPATGGEAKPITPPERFSSSPSLSPDGQTLAYQALRDGYFQVFLASADGSNARQATNGPWHHLAPSWSPDSQRLVISSNRTGDFSVWELDRTSLTLTQLTFDPGQALDPAWDPTGKTLAYISQRGDGSSLVIRNAAQVVRRLVSSPGRMRAPSWRPDGTVITVVTTTAQGPRLQMVILSDPPVIKPVAPTESAAATPANWLDRNRLLYSADGHIRTREFGAMTGTEIPFSAQLSVETNTTRPTVSPPAPDEARPVQGFAGISILPNGHIVASALGDLWELDPDGTLIRTFTNDSSVDHDPAASRDGRKLAYTSDRGGNTQIWMLDLATGATRQLTNESGLARRPAWDSRADRIAYLAEERPESDRTSLKVLTLDTGEVTDLAGDLKQPGTPAWAPDDGQVGVVQHDEGIPHLVLFAADAGHAPRQSTLPTEIAEPGTTEIQWSQDGKTLLSASPAGLYLLPVQDSGLVGAVWQMITNTPAQVARFLPGDDALVFIADTGLEIARRNAAPAHIPVTLTWQPPPTIGRTIIRASRVFDGIGDAYLPNHEVVIEGSRITAVQPWFATPQSAGDNVIDARGKTLMPGLIDLSVQVSESGGERVGRILLAYGITTIQASGSTPGELREVAERWQAHRSGPRLLHTRDACTTTDTGKENTSAIAGGAARLCPISIEQTTALAASAHANGRAAWSGAWLAAASGLLDAVTPFGTVRRQPADEAITGSGVLYQDAIDTLVHSGAIVVPQLAPEAMPILIADQPELAAVPQYLGMLREQEREAQHRDWASIVNREGSVRRGVLRDRQRLLARVAAGGGRIATASNAPATPYGLGLHAEIRLLADAGFTPAQVLRMATSEPARAVGLQAEIGTLAPGRRADLLIIDGDPMRQLSDLLRLDAVITDGYLRRQTSPSPGAP